MALWQLTLLALVASTLASNGLRGLPVAHLPVTQYLGVPYAQPPVGNLRFQPPKPVSKIPEVYDATQYKPSCLQPPHMAEVLNPLLNHNFNVSEDCLYLNIYVPKHAGDNLAVLVWLPGEGFDYGVASQFDGSRLAAAEKIIVITVQYRVSVFGFFSTGSDSAPGNLGLLDQRMALRWVKNNIKFFGGNSDKITLFGRFTGSMSASMQLTSPLNIEERLFDRVILQSGIATGNWVIDRNPRLAAETLAQLTGCTPSSDEELVTCLQSLPANELLTASLRVPQRFRPVIDGKFMAQDPLEVMQAGTFAPVDVLLGYNQQEGNLCLLTHYALKTASYEKILTNHLEDYELDQIVSRDIADYYKQQNSLAAKAAAHEYRYKNGSRYLDFCSDLYVVSRVEKAARLLAQHVPTFIYYFDHSPSLSNQRLSHGDDMAFTLGLILDYPLADDEEKALARRTVGAFSQFAKTGNPSLQDLPWPRIPQDGTIPEMHFSLNMTADSSIQPSNKDRTVEFWFDVMPLLVDTTCPVTEELNDTFNQLDIIFLSIGILTTTTLVFLLVIVARTRCSQPIEIPFRKL